MKQEYSLKQKLDFCREFCTEISKCAGITKALSELSAQNKNAEARYYLRALFESQFKQLIIKLNILTFDKHSEIRVWLLVEEFNKLYGDRLIELGLKDDLEKEETYRKELITVFRQWDTVRNEYAAHANFASDQDFKVDSEKISIFILSAQKIINTMLRTLAVPSGYPNHTKTTSYNLTVAIDLQEESYRQVKDHLRWVSNS